MCFIHRPEYYLHGAQLDDKPEMRGLAEFIIAKHRSGSVEDVPLRFRAKYARFESWNEADSQFTHGSSASAMNDYDDSQDPLAPPPAAGPLSGGSASIAAAGDEAPF